MYNKCSECGNQRIIVNKKYNLCQQCNYIRIHGISSQEAQISKLKEKLNKVYQLNKKPLKQAKKYIKSSKATKEKRKALLDKDREVYLKVFNSKPNVCEECGAMLPDEFEDFEGSINYIEQYSHIISKGSEVRLRHNEKNFNRLCFHCHQLWEGGDRSKMKIYENNLKIIEELKQSLWK